MKAFIKSIVRWFKRQAGISRLKKAVQVSPLKIVVGASNVFEKGWTPTEYDFLNLLKEEDFKNFFGGPKIDAILSEHVWEHLTEAEGQIGFQNCYNFLKKGGYLRIAIPDGFHPDPKYIEMVKVGGTGAGADDHKVLYNYKMLQTNLEKCGFKVNFLEYFDEKGEFHFVDWDKEKGMVHRSKRYDDRNKDGKLNYTSLIVDAVK